MVRKELNIALVTNNSLHHKYWIVELMKQCNVRCIIHPNPVNKTSKTAYFKKTLHEKGLWFIILILLTKLYNKFSTCVLKKEFLEESKKWFSDAAKDYALIDKRLIFKVTTVNSPEAINILKNHTIDVTCFLGGDIAKKEFINSANIISLNFHSGISPIYNGSGSYAWAMAENRPNLVGGTLMEMTEKIDGGDIIAQFLPSIDENDHASSLFMKTIVGSVQLIKNTIEKLANGDKIQKVPQERSIRYTKAIDWTLYQEIQLKAFYKSGKIKKYLRQESIIEPHEGTFNRLLIPEIIDKTLTHHTL